MRALQQSSEKSIQIGAECADEFDFSIHYQYPDGG